ncbi:interferon-induced protein with tetratricopeptide repeats 1-like [Odontesthes bonariensis]|uniref:antiviral innate immune response effector IFIT1-like n=1 Tax=Odontesthes bonariensis TaxID=219752 RepID=UPI003F590021
MMSAAQSQSELTLEALECHFTWALYDKKDKMLRLKGKLKDIGTEEGNSWLGHIYNLQGFIQYKLGSFEEARRLFSRAKEALHQLRNADEGPWLVVNYGNLAWLHHHLGEEDKSQDYLSKVEALIKKYPSPLQDELHPEILAEKAWTLMNFDKDRKLLAADYFQKAIRMKPDMVQWQTSRVVGLMSVHKHSDTDLEDVLEEIRMAREEDPENFYLAARDLNQCVRRGEQLEDEAHELAKKILINPVSSYSGMKPLVRLYRELRLYDDAVDVVEEALKKHPDEPYLKRCAALCYKWKITSSRDGRPNQRMLDRAISLTEEVISLSPHSSLSKKIDLATIHAKSARGLTKADQMYKELLEADLDPEQKQLLYNSYARYLFYDRKEWQKSIRYNMKAAEIPHQGFYRQNSIKALQKIAERGRDRMCGEIQEFLANLQDSESE